MSNLQERSGHARLFAILVLFAVLPIWFFYIGIQYEKTIRTLVGASAETSMALNE